MRKILRAGLLVLLAFTAAPRVKAGPNGCTTDGTLVPMGDEQIAVSSTAIGFTAAKIAPSGGPQAVYAIFSVETNAIRYRDNGLAPTASVGLPMASGSNWTVCGVTTISRALFIRQSADATVSVSYYRQGN